MTIPIFKSHYSIGKSILTLSPPKKRDCKESMESSCSVFDIAKENGLQKLVLVENTLIGFPQAQKVAKEIGAQLIFGVLFEVCEDCSSEEAIKKSQCKHKVIVFPKNANGCKDLNKIYTECKTNLHNFLDMASLKSLWNEENLSLAVPFYDSFIFKNLMSFDTCMISFNFTTPTFFLEDNGLPFDNTIRQAVEKYCLSNNFYTQETQSIFYEKKKDFSAYLTYKLICSRGSFSGRQSSIEKPNFDHLGSDSFCWESYIEKTHE